MYRLIVPFLLALSGCTPSGVPTPPAIAPPQRIISTLPSITEVLFDLELGSKIVGDSAFTKYPPEAAKIDKIGGLYDSNREKIIALKPDLIILSAENTALRQSLSLPILIVDHRTLQGVLESYLIIGEAFGPDTLPLAQKKRQALIDQMNALEQSTKGKLPIRTLICIDRSYGTGRIQNLFVAGADSFLNDVLNKAGGENVAASLGLLAPQLSAEGIIRLAPDVIIDIQIHGRNHTQSESDWQSLDDSVPAVRNRHILTLTDDFATVPGPRTPLLIETIIRYFESLGDKQRLADLPMFQ